MLRRSFSPNSTFQRPNPFTNEVPPFQQLGVLDVFDIHIKKYKSYPPAIIHFSTQDLINIMIFTFNSGSLSLVSLTFLGLLLVMSYLWKIASALRSPLSKIPGPWYASLTAMHLRYGFATGTIWKLAESCHKNHGKIVRLGPRQVWISDKASMKQILSSIDLPKVAMYAEISRDRFSPGLFGEM